MKFLSLIICLFWIVICKAQDTLSLVFVGDVMQHQAQINAANNGSGYNYEDYFPHVRKYIESADLAVANLEVTLAGKPYSGYPQFCAPDELAVALKEAGFNMLVTANNHSCDKGGKGIRRTLQVLDTLHMPHTGTFRNQAERDSLYPLIWEKNNFRITVLNYTYGTNGIPVPFPAVVNLIDTVKIAADIIKAKAMRPDVIIANMHWGEEYKLHPNKEQQALVDFLIRHGVHLVIGGHPHVLQRMEQRYDANGIARQVVVYSLGNFISNMRAKHTVGGVMAHIRLVKCDEEIRMDECGYRLVWVYKPVIEGKQRFFLLPVADFETNPDYFANEAEFTKMMEFAAAMRKLYDKETIGFTEYK